MARHSALLKEAPITRFYVLMDSEALARMDVLDPRHLAQLCSLKVNGKNTLFLELTHLFMKEAPARMERLRLFLEAGQVEDAGKLAHAFVGSLASLGARQMQTAMKELELAAEQGEITLVRERMDLVEQSWERLLAALRGREEGASL